MQLHGSSPKIQSGYLGAVRGLARFFRKSPDRVSEAELRRYFLHLSRYAFRVAITNSRIQSFDQGEVTFGYRDNRPHQIQRLRLSAGEFIGRSLRHVLPRGLDKVRSYGPTNAPSADQLQRARALMKAQTPDSKEKTAVENPRTSDLPVRN